MAKRPMPKDPDRLQQEAKAAAEEAVRAANAHRKKIGARRRATRSASIRRR